MLSTPQAPNAAFCSSNNSFALLFISVLDHSLILRPSTIFHLKSLQTHGKE